MLMFADSLSHDMIVTIHVSLAIFATPLYKCKSSIHFVTVIGLTYFHLPISLKPNEFALGLSTVKSTTKQ